MVLIWEKLCAYYLGPAQHAYAHGDEEHGDLLLDELFDHVDHTAAWTGYLPDLCDRIRDCDEKQTYYCMRFVQLLVKEHYELAQQYFDKLTDTRT